MSLTVMAAVITGPTHDERTGLARPAVRRSVPAALFDHPHLPAAPWSVAQPQSGRPVRRRSLRGRRQLFAPVPRPDLRHVAGQYVRGDADDRAGAHRARIEIG